MTVRQLLTKVRDKLQDTEKTYWSDSELLDLLNECKRYLASERKEGTSTTSIDLITDTYEYAVHGVLRYISVKDSDGNVRDLYPDDGSGEDETDGVIVIDYNRIYVNNPVTGTSLSIKHIAFPEEDNLNDNVRTGDEESFRYYILSKAYEKDTAMENFSKSQHFWQMFLNAFRYAKKNSSVNYNDTQRTIKSYFF